MLKLLVTVALLMVVTHAVKQITMMHYSEDGCSGTVTSTKVDVDTCLPHRDQNWTAMKLGFPRDVTVATLYFDASPNCTTLGSPHYVPCGRCQYSGRGDVGYFRYFCDIKRQTVNIIERCTSDKCDSCARHYNDTVGECKKYINDTKTLKIGEIRKVSAIPQVLFDNPNSTCIFHTAVGINDVICSQCFGRTRYNCTLIDSESETATELAFSSRLGRH